MLSFSNKHILSVSFSISIQSHVTLKSTMLQMMMMPERKEYVILLERFVWFLAWKGLSTEEKRQVRDVFKGIETHPVTSRSSRCRITKPQQ